MKDPAVDGEAPIGRRRLNHRARPEEVAAARMFLLSDEASFIAGAELYGDGGMRRA
ncbi:SDR family oxidoreductase [Pseudoroseomonas ludipueritiae]|uniref:SDR family oxidoreductase n=1 Tax=Pseudoroseomonas ludipueritiae TaxID=198093 RepID=UPI00193119DF|nr:SDR family oxidoreductase [Pseudoroseomonas ludipueritiae]